MPKYTETEIEEKTDDVVIDIIKILEEWYPVTMIKIIQQIQEETQREIKEKTDDVVIDMIKILEESYPVTMIRIIEQIQEEGE